jgi:hypothetical protein
MDDGEENSSDRLKLIARFIKAGWIVGEYKVTPDYFGVTFTGLGIEAMERASAALKEIRGWSGAPINAQNFAAINRDSAPLKEIQAELEPPNLTTGELWELMEIFFAYANQGPPRIGAQWQFPKRG